MTGTHVYTAFRCLRNVALDLAGDRALRRPLRGHEEHLLARGRSHEDTLVARLVAEEGWQEPDHPERDFAAGERATLELLKAGVPGVLQGVLRAAPDDGVARLGIPDLLRRVDGTSSFGDFHYEVGDVKSSARMRGDQILQVVFYARMLAQVQDRMPEEGYILLKDGREERFRIADYLPAIDGVEERLVAVHRDPDSVRPFRVRACSGCRWDPVCSPSLEQEDHLSLVDGMTGGVAETLARAGVASAGELASCAADAVARRTGFDLALLRRLQRAALARGLERPLPERCGRVRVPGGEPVVMAGLFDAYADRLLWAGAARLADGGLLAEVTPDARAREWQEFLALAGALPHNGPVWHAGRALPRWLDECMFDVSARGGDDAVPAWDEIPDLDGERFVDVVQRVRTAASWPRPVFGIDDLIEQALGRDPHRAGRADEAAYRAESDDDGGRAWLQARGRVLIDDLVGLVDWLAEHGGADAARSVAGRSGGT